MNDPRDTFRSAIEHAGAVVAATPSAAMEGPTPCEEFDVRRLLGHMITVLRRVAHAIDDGAPFDIPHVTEGIADDDWVRTWKEDAAALGERIDDDEVLDQMLTLPWGVLPGRATIQAYTSELATHAWDLAVAIGRIDLLDDGLAEACLPVMQAFVPEEPRGGPIPFGAVIPVGPDAGAYERLVAWMGRDPRWEAVRGE